MKDTLAIDKLADAIQILAAVISDEVSTVPRRLVLETRKSRFDAVRRLLSEIEKRDE